MTPVMPPMTNMTRKPIPGGLVYIAGALTLLVTWIQQSENADAAPSRPTPMESGDAGAAEVRTTT